MPAIGASIRPPPPRLCRLLSLCPFSSCAPHPATEIAAHREWMLRTFSTGLAVATIRPIVGIFYATSAFSGLTPHEFFGTAFWLGFVLHLMVTEGWII